MGLVQSAILGFPAVWLLSALLHVVDPDVGGIAGLVAPEILVSVTAVAGLLLVPGLVPLLAYAVAGGRGYAVGLLATAGAVGLILAAAGSGAVDAAGWLISLAGTTTLCALVFLLATLPSLFALRRRAPTAV
jgi:hypothetical protein